MQKPKKVDKDLFKTKDFTHTKVKVVAVSEKKLDRKAEKELR